MNYYELGAGAILGAGIISSFLYLYYRVQRLESQLVVAREKNVDNKIIQKDHALSDAERAALLHSNLGD